jgi:hypothetical protein
MEIDSKTRLAWFPELGRGYYPVKIDGQYGYDYWKKYIAMSATDMGEALNTARVNLVQQYAGYDPVVDIGIGSGAFIVMRNESAPVAENTWGYDVNPYAIYWLIERGLWHDPYFIDPENATCWDSLEHMKHPEAFVRRVQKHLFISIPIFEGETHALRSKHFRPDEHFHYFTERGLIEWMKKESFDLVTKNKMETDLGREDIGTFVFKRGA